MPKMTAKKTSPAARKKEATMIQIDALKTRVSALEEAVKELKRR